jgi:hypothetical protein
VAAELGKALWVGGGAIERVFDEEGDQLVSVSACVAERLGAGVNGEAQGVVFGLDRADLV